MKICSVCGREFNPGYSWQKYCSPDCRKVAQHQKQREWYYQHKEIRRERWQQYCVAHKEEILDRARPTRYENGQHPGQRSDEYWANRYY